MQYLRVRTGCNRGRNPTNDDSTPRLLALDDGTGDAVSPGRSSGNRTVSCGPSSEAVVKLPSMGYPWPMHDGLPASCPSRSCPEESATPQVELFFVLYFFGRRRRRPPTLDVCRSTQQHRPCPRARASVTAIVMRDPEPEPLIMFSPSTFKCTVQPVFGTAVSGISGR